MKFITPKVFVRLTSLVIGCLFIAIVFLGYLVLTKSTTPDNGDVSALEVTIPQGKLRGVFRHTFLGRRISAFLGVPFAEPPLGLLRYKPPVKPSAWNGTFIADNDNGICPQYLKQKFLGVEDCLHVNIFTPNVPVKSKESLMPTMVYIYGGNFKQGDHASKVFNHIALLDEDVVLVVPNYRLGAIGFLSTGDGVVPGNNAMKDMVRALEWVQENIEYFGGDPSRVTLFGHSSGAGSVHLIALSPLSDGLFHRYITQSSTGVSRCSFTDRSILAERAFQVGSYVGCLTNDTTELIDCLTKTDIRDIILTEPKFLELDEWPDSIWTPTAEPDLEGSFLTDHPMNLVASGKVRDLPWILGITSQDAIDSTACYYDDEDKWITVLRHFDDFLPYLFIYKHQPINVTAYTEDVRAYYFKDMTIGADLILANLTDALTDALAAYPAWFVLQQQVALATSPTYFYIFDYLGTFSYSYMYCGHPKVHGVAHGDELLYLFDIIENFYVNLSDTFNSADYEMRSKLVSIWTSFATDGVPLTSSDSNSTLWEPYDPRENNILRIGDGNSTKISVQHSFNEERMLFWAEMQAKYGC